MECRDDFSDGFTNAGYFAKPILRYEIPNGSVSSATLSAAHR